MSEAEMKARIDFRKFDINSNRWCSYCRTSKHPRDGMYILFNGGKNQRWICNECKEKRDEKTSDRK